MYEDLIPQLEVACKLRNLQPGTLRSYTERNMLFLRWAGKDPNLLTCQDVQDFIIEKRDAGLSPSTCNLYISSIRFLFRFVLHKAWDANVAPAMKVEHSIPKILTPEQICQMLSTTENLKHKAIIALLYGSGLRVSEVARLEYRDISREQMQIHVRNSKNWMDRYTILSHRALSILTEYWYTCGRPRGMLFPGRTNSEHISRNMVEFLVADIGYQAGIPFHVTPHMLRHSFATHLLEAGTDVRYIQSLLGHKHISSTEIYLHISNKNLIGIRSPFDTMLGDHHG